MLAQGERVRVRGDIADERTVDGRIRCESQDRFDLGVLGKDLGRIDGDTSARGVEFVGPLLEQRVAYAVRVAQEKIRGIHENRSAIRRLARTLRRHGEATYDGFREGLAHRQPLGRIVRGTSKVFIGLDQQNFRANPLETNHSGTRHLAAVQS